MMFEHGLNLIDDYLNTANLETMAGYIEAAQQYFGVKITKVLDITEIDYVVSHYRHT